MFCHFIGGWCGEKGWGGRGGGGDVNRDLGATLLRSTAMKFLKHEMEYCFSLGQSTTLRLFINGQ